MIHEKIMLFPENEQVYLDSYIADPVDDTPRKAILVIPGGGYGSLCSYREGEPIALAFFAQGYNAFVLHYTVGRKKPFPAQLIEAAQAITHIRDHAAQYRIDPNAVFAVGFSAGGHLAASTAVLWKHPAVEEALGQLNGRNKPTGVMLMYPVICDHYESFQNLWCSDTPTEEQLKTSALNNYVDADSAPAFMLHTANDEMVTVRNTLSMAGAYAAAGVPFETHIYPYGPHGMALANAVTEDGRREWNDPAIAEWVHHAVVWAERFC